MSIPKKKILVIVIGAIVLLSLWYVNMKLKDEKSLLFQLREIFFPTEYSRGQMRNFEADISYVGKQWKYHDSGKRFFEAGEYEKSIEEYKKAIELAQNDPRGSLLGIENQKFPRGALMEVYEKSERYLDAIDQIDWLLAHKPSDSYRSELAIWKNIILAESVGDYEKAIKCIDDLLKSGEFQEYKFVIPKFSTKREELQRKLMTRRAYE